jgi:nucleotide-binding universal stress UspA family protein
MTGPTLIMADGRVLAALDASLYTQSVGDHAAWAAGRLQSPLGFVHTIERPNSRDGSDLSGNLGLGEQDALLKELARLDEQRGRVEQLRGRALLDQASARVAPQLSQPATRQLRQGALVDSLLDLQPDTRLIVIGKRGEHADFARGHLGRNLERVVRAVNRPVLVASRAFKPIERFLIAYDGSATTQRCVELVCASPLLKGLTCELLQVGEDTASQRQQLEWAASRLREAGFSPTARLLPGSAEKVIIECAQSRNVDLLVMGAYGHSRIRHLIVGSTTTQVLRACHIPMLLLR